MYDRVGLLFVLAAGITIVVMLGLTQSASAATTIISTSTTVGNYTVNAGDKLQVSPGVTMTVTDTFKNFGTVDNDGTIDLKDSKVRRGASTFNNFAGAVLNNFNQIKSSWPEGEGEFSTRTLTNAGMIKNYGNLGFGFYNNTGTIINTGGIFSSTASEFMQGGLRNKGTFENYGSLSANFLNQGFTLNNGSLGFGGGGGGNDFGATLINFGNISGHSFEP
jgi:hypothetical protein